MEKESFFPKSSEAEKPPCAFLRKEFNKEVDLFFQKEFLKAVDANDESRLAKLKRQYSGEYPDQLESVEVIFGLNDFLRKEKKLDEEKERRDYKSEKSRFKDLTEYQFLFTHYLIENSHDREFLNQLWKMAEAVGRRAGAEKQFSGLRRGLLSQVAVYKILEAIGEKPQLSHPDEDAFHAVDLWAHNDTAVQIKASRAVEEPEVLESEHLAFPAVEAKSEREARYYNAKYFQDSVRFRAKIRNYGREIGKEIKGYMLIVPYSKIDSVTGEPSLELTEFFKEKLSSKQA